MTQITVRKPSHGVLLMKWALTKNFHKESLTKLENKLFITKNKLLDTKWENMSTVTLKNLQEVSLNKICLIKMLNNN